VDHPSDRQRAATRASIRHIGTVRCLRSEPDRFRPLPRQLVFVEPYTPPCQSLWRTALTTARSAPAPRPPLSTRAEIAALSFSNGPFLGVNALLLQPTQRGGESSGQTATAGGLNHAGSVRVWRPAGRPRIRPQWLPAGSTSPDVLPRVSLGVSARPTEPKAPRRVEKSSPIAEPACRRHHSNPSNWGARISAGLFEVNVLAAIQNCSGSWAEGEKREDGWSSSPSKAPRLRDCATSQPEPSAHGCARGRGARWGAATAASPRRQCATRSVHGHTVALVGLGG